MFLNMHTVNETLDLIRAKDIGRADVSKTRVALGKAPDSTWDEDFSAFSRRYELAKTAFNFERGMVSTESPFVSDDIRTTETAYQAILASLSKTPGFVQKGDFQDLWNRAESAKGSPIQENVGSIQPHATDVDLETFKAIDKLPIPKTGKGLIGWAIGGVVGILGLFFLARR